jgi:hypothetical protein
MFAIDNAGDRIWLQPKVSSELALTHAKRVKLVLKDFTRMHWW